MVDQQLPTVRVNKNRVNKKKSFESRVFWVRCALFAVLAVYGTLMLGYHADRFPSWLETGIHASGISFYLEKEYEAGTIEGWTGIIDPHLEKVAVDTEMEVSYAGYIEDVDLDLETGTVTQLTLSRMDSPLLQMEGNWKVLRVLVEKCITGDTCDVQGYFPGDLSDVSQGKLVEVHFHKNWNDAAWEISKIRVRNS